MPRLGAFPRITAGSQGTFLGMVGLLWGDQLGGYNVAVCKLAQAPEMQKHALSIDESTALAWLRS